MSKMKKLLIDTDLGGDCDDAGALAIANVLMAEGRCQLLGVTHTTSSPYNLACLQAIDEYYHHPEIPLGAYRGPLFIAGPQYERFDKDMAKAFPNRYSESNQPAVEAVRLWRSLLSEAADQSITLVGIGPFRNLANLLRSPADEISPLSGKELLERKVVESVFMAGDVERHHYAEYNVREDIPSAQLVAENIPTPVVYLDFTRGEKVYCGQAFFEPGHENNPVAFAYTHYSNVARSSWDPLTVYYAIMGEDGLFHLSENGDLHFDDKGHTVFVPNPQGRSRYLKLAVSRKKAASVLDALLLRSPN
jgi:inosine-uridine nucleoside N-ribohydrolase